MRKRILTLLTVLSLVFPAVAQVTIGSDNIPDENALLDLKENAAGTSSKGLLLPRVALDSVSSPELLKSTVQGMYVYNTSSIGGVTPGMYFNNGSGWVRVGSDTGVQALSARNGVHIDVEDGVSIIGLGTTPLVENTEITQDGHRFDIITGTDTFNIAGNLRTDNLYLDNVEIAGVNNRTLVWNMDSKKVGYTLGVQTAVTFMQTKSVDQTSSVILLGPVSSPATDTMVVTWLEQDVVIDNGLTTFDDATDIFTLVNDATIELSGSIGFIANYGATIGSPVTLNLSIQTRKAGDPLGEGWIDYSTITEVIDQFSGQLIRTVTIPPAIYQGGVGDQIRMVVVLRPGNQGGSFANPAIVAPNGNPISKSIKMMQL